MEKKREKESEVVVSASSTHRHHMLSVLHMLPLTMIVEKREGE